jgi:hypothetical protein
MAVTVPAIGAVTGSTRSAAAGSARVAVSRISSRWRARPAAAGPSAPAARAPGPAGWPGHGPARRAGAAARRRRRAAHHLFLLGLHLGGGDELLPRQRFQPGLGLFGQGQALLVELDLLLELLQLALQGVDALGQRLLLGLGHPAGLLLGVGQALQPGVEGLLQLPLRRAGQAGVAHGQGHQQLAGLHRLALLHGQALHPRHLGRHDAHQPAGRDEHPADLHAPAALPQARNRPRASTLATTPAVIHASGSGCDSCSVPSHPPDDGARPRVGTGSPSLLGTSAGGWGVRHGGQMIGRRRQPKRDGGPVSRGRRREIPTRPKSGLVFPDGA